MPGRLSEINFRRDFREGLEDHEGSVVSFEECAQVAGLGFVTARETHILPRNVVVLLRLFVVAALSSRCKGETRRVLGSPFVVRDVSTRVYLSC